MLLTQKLTRPGVSAKHNRGTRFTPSRGVIGASTGPLMFLRERRYRAHEIGGDIAQHRSPIRNRGSRVLRAPDEVGSPSRPEACPRSMEHAPKSTGKGSASIQEIPSFIPRDPFLLQSNTETPSMLTQPFVDCLFCRRQQGQTPRMLVVLPHP